MDTTNTLDANYNTTYTTGTNIIWQPEEIVYSLLQQGQVCEIRTDKGEDMNSFLVDLAVRKTMTAKQVDLVKAIMAHGDWKDRILLFMLVEFIQDGSIRKVKDLGYDED